MNVCQALIDTEQAEQDQDQAELAWSSQPYASSFGPNGVLGLDAA